MTKRPSLFSSPPPQPAERPAATPAGTEEPRRHAVARTRKGKRNATTYLDPAAF